MKYIRTKDGEILKAPNIYDNGAVVLSSDPPQYETRNAKNEWGCVFCHDVIKQADTIEGLCDAYVITSKQGHIYDTYGDYNYELKEVLPQAKEECPYEDWNLYGCIIVDGIIKQVAKFNDEKGKLELL